MLDKSQVEGVIACEELFFKDSYQLYKLHFSKEAMKHPAKANLFMVTYFVEKYTIKGDTILDCCSGTGSTGYIAGLLGRKSILVEVEPRYVEWMIETFRNYPFPKPTILRGDSRLLSEGLNKIGNPEISIIIFSPPYSDMLKGVAMMQGGYSYTQKGQVGRLGLVEHLLEVEKIYRECWKILKNEQKMILIVRNYNRKGSVVDYVYETYKLCKAVGFTLTKTYKFRLPKIRSELISYYRSHPQTPRILHEHILVFDKIVK